MVSKSFANPAPDLEQPQNPGEPSAGPGEALATGGERPDPELAEHFARLLEARHDAPHECLGPHRSESAWIVRLFDPHSERVDLRVPGTRDLEMRRVLPEGLFEAAVDAADLEQGYEFLSADGEGVALRRDPYAFRDAWFTAEDDRLFTAGFHTRLHEKLGARRFSQDGVEGVGFAVWAPNARRVSVVGTFNRWDGRCNPMRRLTASGIWDLFIPDLPPGGLYKFEILPPEGPAFLKADPFARHTEAPLATAGLVPDAEPAAPSAGIARPLAGGCPLAFRLSLDAEDDPESAAGSRPASWATAERLAEFRALGHTHVEPVSARPGHGGSAGGFAPGEAYGGPEGFPAFAAACHAEGLGVIVPAFESRLPEDLPELRWFDGAPVFEAAEPGDAGLFALDRGEVRSFLLSNALYWLEVLQADGLRTDARAARLYRELFRLEPLASAGRKLFVRGMPDRNRLSEVDVDRLVRGRHDDPHAVLGPHRREETGELVLRALAPRAEQVTAWFPDEPDVAWQLRRIHPDGLFETAIPDAVPGRDYRLVVAEPGEPPAAFADPYAYTEFTFTEADEKAFAKGRHYRIYEKLGAHPQTEAGVAGVGFAVWAPNAEGVSVTGAFSRWDGRRLQMQRRGLSGVWEIFVPGLAEGTAYRYEIRGHDGQTHVKSDPYAFYAEIAPATASIVRKLEGAYTWQDGDWMARRRAVSLRDRPVATYEVHLGSWLRGPNGEPLTYPEAAEKLIPYLLALGFTHIELLPISEHPYEPSWGYQVTGYFAATSRYGRPEELMRFVDLCHQAGLGVILDWVPGHFPKDAHGLARFDGTCLYEHADPRQGEHRDWGTLVFNYGRPEVENFLIASARFWLEHYHFDGLRVDAVASMLYLDYSRPEPGSWIPNRYGGRENLEAIEFLRHINTMVQRDFPGVLMIAEESTAWPGVSKPVEEGGLGFGYKWNMGWMHDVLAYMSTPPDQRRHQHGKLTFCLVYAFAENYVLSLSHDEVVHLKRSLLNKMPGGEWEKFANLRLLYAFMYGHPGKKLLFMGAEFGQRGEWNHAAGLEWPLLEQPLHGDLLAFVADLNRLYRSDPAFFEADFRGLGFEWLDADNAEDSIVAFLRKARDPRHSLLFVMNFSLVSRPWHRLGVPYPVAYREILDTNAAAYGGCAGNGPPRETKAEDTPWNGRDFSIVLAVPALTALVLRPAPPEPPGPDSVSLAERNGLEEYRGGFLEMLLACRPTTDNTNNSGE